jgi:hypothetical protein
MSRNGQAKPKSRGSQPTISNSGAEVLLTRHRTASIFQRGVRLDVKKGNATQDNAGESAVIEQFGLFGDVLRSEVYLPLNSDIWRKLPVKRETGEGGFE